MDDGRRTRRNFLTAILVLVACAKPPAEPSPEPRLAHPGYPLAPLGETRRFARPGSLRSPGGGAGGRMDFAPPKGVPDEHWCEDDSMPEAKAGSGACFRTPDECARMSEHLWKQYAKPEPVPPCTKRPRVHCFDMVSRGTPHEVCRSTARGCAEHHRVETGDSWVDTITDGCEQR